MKICLINSLYPPDERGGAERMVARQARQFSDQGHEVMVITTARCKELAGMTPPQSPSSLREGETYQRGRPSRTDVSVGTPPFAKGEHTPLVPPLSRGGEGGVKVYRLKPRNLCPFYSYSKMPLLLRLLWLARDMVNTGTAYQIRQTLQAERPDRVYTHNLRGLGYLVPGVIKKLNLRHYHTLHDIQLLYPSGILLAGSRGSRYDEEKFYNKFFLRKWYAKFTRKKFGSPEKIIAPSQWILDLHTRNGFFPESKHVVRYPLPTVGFKVDTSRAVSSSGPLKLLYVGQLETTKGILFLLQAIKQLPVTSYQLEVIGQGSKLNEAKRLAGDDPRIVFHGHLRHDQLENYYKQADVTVVPSLAYENAPTVIFESLSAGTPVLAARIGGIPEFVREGKNGWLYEVGDERSFINKLKQIMGD